MLASNAQALLTLSTNPVEIATLIALQARGRVESTLSDLATALNLKTSIAAFRRSISSLLRRGLIQRTQDPEDKRRGVWELGEATVDALGHREGSREPEPFEVSDEVASRARAHESNHQLQLRNCETLTIFEGLRPDCNLSAQQRSTFLGLVKVYGEKTVKEYLPDILNPDVLYPFAYLRACLRNHNATLQSRHERFKTKRRELMRQAKMRAEPVNAAPLDAETHPQQLLDADGPHAHENAAPVNAAPLDAETHPQQLLDADGPHAHENANRRTHARFNAMRWYLKGYPLESE